MPTELKLLHGERRPSRLNRSAPKAKSGPVMPTGMSDTAEDQTAEDLIWRTQIKLVGNATPKPMRLDHLEDQRQLGSGLLAENESESALGELLDLLDGVVALHQAEQTCADQKGDEIEHLDREAQIGRQSRIREAG